MKRAAVVLLCVVVGVTPGLAEATGGRPADVSGSVAQQIRAIPVYARVSARLVDGRTLDGYLVAKSSDDVTIRPKKAQATPQTVPIASIASIRVKVEGHGLTRGQTIAIAVTAGAAVLVLAWVWAVKSRAFGA